MKIRKIDEKYDKKKKKKMRRNSLDLQSVEEIIFCAR